MKVLAPTLILCVLLFTHCKSIDNTPEIVDQNLIQKAPFENKDFRFERASTNLPDSISKIHFFDVYNGLCITQNGSIFISNDKGLTWTLSYRNVLRFEIVNNQTIVAFAGGLPYAISSDTSNNISRSTDKGKTWTSSQIIKTTALQDITRGVDQNLYTVGQDFIGNANTGIVTILKSQDGGQNWTKLSRPNFFDPIKIVNMSPNKLVVMGYARTNEGTISQIISKDNGLTWEESKTYEYINSTSYSDKIGYYLGFNYGNNINNIYQTYNQGTTWIKIRTINNTVNQVIAVSPTIALILGRGDSNLNAGFSYTTNGGTSWTDMSLLDNLDSGQLINGSFYDAQNGYIVGSKKILYKLTWK